jgi:annexin A7/11
MQVAPQAPPHAFGQGGYTYNGLPIPPPPGAPPAAAGGNPATMATVEQIRKATKGFGTDEKSLIA